MITRIVKWISIPVLLAASIFARYAASYELLVNLVVCTGAVVGVQRAVQLKNYVWAAGFVAIAIVFSPFLLVTKIFLLLGITCIVACLTSFVAFRRRPVTANVAPAVLLCALLMAIPMAGMTQTTEEPLDVKDKLNFHAKNTYAPLSLVGLAAYAAILQQANAPTEWQQGASAYGKRFGTMVAWSGIHGALAFGLDSTLHQDPRYFRSHDTGFWRRSAHVLRGTVLTRTDRGGETLSTWRLGADYGSAFLSNMWYPSRLNTPRLGFIQGSATLGFDMVGNLASEFWPDIKAKVFRRK
jgi:hypothetical protein